jgi:hypothetical protein
MEFSYVYILQIELKPLASRSHQKTLRRPDLSATKAALPFSETPLAISPNRNAAFIAVVSGPTHLQLKFEPGSAISFEEPQPNEIAERRQARY